MGLVAADHAPYVGSSRAASSLAKRHGNSSPSEHAEDRARPLGQAGLRFDAAATNAEGCCARPARPVRGVWRAQAGVLPTDVDIHSAI